MHRIPETTIRADHLIPARCRYTPPGLQEVNLALSWPECLSVRVIETEGHSNEDREKAMTSLERISASYSPGESPSPNQAQALSLAAIRSRTRPVVFANLKCLEDAVSCYCALFNPMSPDHLQHRLCAGSLAQLGEARSTL